MDEFEKQGQVGIRKIINKSLDINTEEKIKAMARYCLDKESRNQITKNLWQVGYSNMQKYVVEHVDYFLPNAQLEMEEMFRYFDFSTKDYTVVPNAIDANIALETLKQSDDKRFEKYRGAVICVGRIEPRKNQLALVKAMFSSDYKLILVGEVSRNQKSYYNKIKKFIDKSDKITHIRKMDNKDLYKLYKVCKVSTLPSWLDTPGLVSLEAAVMGCNLAVSEKGTTTEYFEDYAEYCVPDDLRSIRRAVEKAYRKPYDEGLKEKILTSYTWAEAARKTLEGYNKTLEKRK
jgi:glycosyltransferase involved in cell wall biosynthesis